MNPIGDLLARDRDAGFTLLVESTKDRLFSFALSLTGNRSDADDVAQDAYVRAYRALQRFPDARLRALQARPWLAKIALNVWRNRLRGRRPTFPLDERLPADESSSPAAVAEQSDAAARLRSLALGLPRRYRLALLLRHAYGLPYAEAAVALGVPEGTVKSDVHRGTKMLRDLYERDAKAIR